MPDYIEGDLMAGEARFAIVVSRFNAFITEKLLDGALDALRRHQADMDRVTVVRCPGAYETPLVAHRLAASKAYDAVICLGAVIRGATYHFELVASAAKVLPGYLVPKLVREIPGAPAKAMITPDVNRN